MFDKLTFKNKNRIFLLLMVATLFLMYKLVVSKTVRAYQDYEYLKKQSSLSKDIDTRIDKLDQHLNSIKTIFSSSIVTDNNAQEKILEMVTSYCKGKPLLLKEFPKTVLKETDGFMVELNYFTVEGDFKNLLSLVYTLEQKVKVGKVASVNFMVKENLKTKRNELTATIYIQNLKQENT
ncbi:MAG TPA: hypothetical protein VNX01_07805 [Bacteroidia bacterium]|jgi:hypothetical protein|nr:hypothetical protein [Bacteroidia bacterium]